MVLSAKTDAQTAIAQLSYGAYHKLIPNLQAPSISPDVANQDFLELKIQIKNFQDQLQRIIHSFSLAQTSQQTPINHLPPSTT